MPNRLESRLAFAKPAPIVLRRNDGTILVRSAHSLDVPQIRIGDWLKQWAAKTPDQTLLAERNEDGAWRRITYREGLDAARRLGASLLKKGLGPACPLLILSGNGVDHGLLALGASLVGVPIVPVSTAYSLLSRDHSKLRQIAADVQPGLVFAADPMRFGAALAALGIKGASMVELLDAEWTQEAEDAEAAVGPDTIVKILYTSGSTGSPKGVINTQRMITSNQAQAASVWPFLAEAPPVMVDWLPWSHTFGGNFTFHTALANGGTLYVDFGKPTPGEFDKTVANLREVSPTIYFNVPRGFELLVPQLEGDETLRRRFFQRCGCIFYAAAALPRPLWDRLELLALKERGGDLALISAWGSTETAPMATAAHGGEGSAQCIGLPVPGCELKLVPSAGKLEARLRGPNVTPGYWKKPEADSQAFDEEGFYRIGDALRFVDPDNPERGLQFDGRVAEDFKLTSGTWVHVGALRMRLIEAGRGLIQDAVIAGHDRDEVGALVFVSEPMAAQVGPHEIPRMLRDALRRLAEDPQAGSSLRIGRLLVLAEPPSLDAGEINDKGYLNQRQVLQRRVKQVEELYKQDAEGPSQSVVRI